MWDARKRYPSLPSNYISIIQLKERWMKEQDKQQKKEQEERGDLHKHREEKEGSQNERVSRVMAPPQIHPKRNKFHWVVKVSSQKPQGPEVKKDRWEIKVRARDQELKIKEDCWRVDTSRKLKAEKELTEGTVQQVSRNGSAEKFPGRVNQMARMYRRIEKPSMNPAKKEGSSTTDASGHRWNPAFSRRFGRQKTAGAGLAWVRKGERSGASASQS